MSTAEVIEAVRGLAESSDSASSRRLYSDIGHLLWRLRYYEEKFGPIDGSDFCEWRRCTEKYESDKK